MENVECYTKIEYCFDCLNCKKGFKIHDPITEEKVICPLCREEFKLNVSLDVLDTIN